MKSTQRKFQIIQIFTPSPVTASCRSRAPSFIGVISAAAVFWTGQNAWPARIVELPDIATCCRAILATGFPEVEKLGHDRL
jgi:hypothetical protein